MCRIMRTGLNVSPAESLDSETNLTDQSATEGRPRVDPLVSRQLRLRLVRVAPRSLTRVARGFSLSCARYGIQVTIFVDRVEQALARVAPSFATVLGHALAHEIGHVLLRSERHRPTGLMRAVWGELDWRLGGLWFTTEDAAEMRRELLRIATSSRPF